MTIEIYSSLQKVIPHNGRCYDKETFDKEVKHYLTSIKVKKRLKLINKLLS
jgi:hypothetical protein